jgi:hypothetical protein
MDFIAEQEKEQLFDDLQNGSEIGKQVASIKLRHYIESLEDQIQHLRFMNKSKDDMITCYKGMLERNGLIG